MENRVRDSGKRNRKKAEDKNERGLEGSREEASERVKCNQKALERKETKTS